MGGAFDLHRARTRWGWLLALCLLLAAAAGVTLALHRPTDGAAPAPGDAHPAGSAAELLAVLDRIPVSEPDARADYDRDAFGQRWSDDVDVDGGHNGCDTRNDILRRDLGQVRIKEGTHGCVVLSGTLTDPYTGTAVTFVRGQATSDDVQIDHVVSLADAWQTGARSLSPDRRRDLANDPLNLLAAVGTVNQSKGDASAAEWLPSEPGARCELASRQILVKSRYGLWVTGAERRALASALAGCG